MSRAAWRAIMPGAWKHSPIMNQRARELGAARSNFMNPNGLPMPGQYSTARDLSLIARAAYANPVIR